jgi:hypothetical protein
MNFFVYRTKRNISLWQFHTNLPCIGTHHASSTSDKTDAELIEQVSNDSGYRLVSSVCSRDGKTIAAQIGIFVCPDGYALMPLFGDEDFAGKEFFIPKFGAVQG